MSQPSKKMVVGFNHNIKHNGKVYHVQTEDSGVDNPHVITHLFVGGNILSSRRSSYAHLMSAPDREAQVRAMMEAQHKEMLRNLVSGALEKTGGPAAGRAFQPGELVPAPSKTSSPPAADVPLTITEEGIGAMFVEDLVSEKSLDEVILSYLAGESEHK
jgi:hypothetical protein